MHVILCDILLNLNVRFNILKSINKDAVNLLDTLMLSETYNYVHILKK